MPTIGLRAARRTNAICAALMTISVLAAACSTPTADNATSQSTSAPTTRQTQGAPETTTTTEPTTTTEATDPFSLHVDPAGDDSGPGTARSPFATIERALDLVAPGGVIHLGPGRYAPFSIERHDDVTITSEIDQPAIIEGSDYADGPGITVSNSTNVRLENVHVTRVLWGIWLESAEAVHIVGTTISDLGQEGIMVKYNTSDVVIEDNTIHTTGQRPGENRGRPFSDFGEGIYIGNAGPLDDGSNDESNGIVVRNNVIHSTTAEAVDIKAWTDDILVEGNLIYDVDTATSGAIVVGIGDVPSTADNIVIRANVIHSVTRTSEFDHGNAVVISAPATVVGNVIWDVQHYGILVDRRLGTSGDGSVLISDNIILDAGIQAIAQLPNDSGVPVVVADNVVGVAAEELLGPLPTVDDAWAAVRFPTDP